MLLVIETITAFTVIMMLLSFMVKSLASVVKNHVNYYADNLRAEVEHFFRAVVNVSFGKLEDLKDASGQKAVLANVPWRRLGEEFLTKKNLEKVLEAMGKEVPDLEERLKPFQANVKYNFDVRMRNLALACGLGLCLFANINALEIWRTLYSDSQVRAKFSSAEYVDSVTKRFEAANSQVESEQQAVGQSENVPAEIQKLQEQLKAAETQGNDDQVTELRSRIDRLQKLDDLARQRDNLRTEFEAFKGDVSFGIGRIWRNDSQSPPDLFYEFFGSLLTGILISIGAPYWHDLLRMLSSARSGKA